MRAPRGPENLPIPHLRKRSPVPCFYKLSLPEAASSPVKNALARTLPRDGFTLFEALVVVALMGLILSILATVTAHWIPNWRAGFARIQTAELASAALDRITSDLAAAEFIAPIGEQRPLFYGSASTVTFVRSPVGPRSPTGPAPTGLEIIRFADSAAEGGLVRSRVPFSPETSAAVNGADSEFSDASLLLRAPLRASFAFAGRDRVWNDDWIDATATPSAVRITVRDGDSDEILAVSTATPIHVNAPAACALQGGDSPCLENNGKGSQKPAPGADQPAPQRSVL
jgi:general secretion pathway protein J